MTSACHRTAGAACGSVQPCDRPAAHRIGACCSPGLLLIKLRRPRSLAVCVCTLDSILPWNVAGYFSAVLRATEVSLPFPDPKQMCRPGGNQRWKLSSRGCRWEPDGFLAACLPLRGLVSRGKCCQCPNITWGSCSMGKVAGQYLLECCWRE